MLACAPDPFRKPPSTVLGLLRQNFGEFPHLPLPVNPWHLLDDLAERGWLSDARYAEAVVRRRTGQYARRSIAQLLKRAGVDEEVSASALEKSPENDPDEEFAAALALCQRKFRNVPVEQKEKARQIRFLQSRGYSLGLALRVVKQRGAVHDESEGP